MADHSNDPELLLMNQVKRKLDKLPAAARVRVITWLRSKYIDATGEPVTE